MSEDMGMIGIKYWGQRAGRAHPHGTWAPASLLRFFYQVLQGNWKAQELGL